MTKQNRHRAGVDLGNELGAESLVRLAMHTGKDVCARCALLSYASTVLSVLNETARDDYGEFGAVIAAALSAGLEEGESTYEALDALVSQINEALARFNTKAADDGGTILDRILKRGV